MKKAVLMIVLLAITVGLGGCIVSVNGDCGSKKKVKEAQIDATIAEIDAVEMLGSESARLNVLTTIARRPGLSPEARLHLIDAIGSLGSESSREEVLMILAENPPIVSPPKPCGEKID